MRKNPLKKKSFSSETALLFSQSLELLKTSFLKTAGRYDSGAGFQRAYTGLVDETVSKIADACFTGMKEAEAPVIVALGGYGRRELAPYSDIDIVFVCEHPADAPAKKFIEALSGHFWKAGIRLSSSVRTLAECEKDMPEDILFLTSLLEKRRIWGSESVYRKLENIFQRHIEASPPGFFVSAKLSERAARHLKMGDSRYHLEPDLKEGKGALRDIHMLLWISNFLYGVHGPEDMVRKNILTPKEADTLKRALDFFFTARCHLHFMAGRADDRLSFDSQPAIAECMGYRDEAVNARAEKFMKDYFLLAREVGHLTRIICAKIESESLGGGATSGVKKMILREEMEKFPVKGNRLTVENASYFKKFPPEIIRIFRVSQTTGLDIHPDALRHIRNLIGKISGELQKSAEACRLFMDILLDRERAEPTLRFMNEAEVLSALIPDFNNIVAHMQYGMYHVYTADEHTIRAVGMMHGIENGDLAASAPLATELFPAMHSRRALYAAVFFHDIAKGTGEDHSKAGARIALGLCPRLGLTAEETETAVWLVREHLAMTMTAFKRDLGDPKTIQDFAAVVQSPERLRLLILLTTADIMAVGPERWNAWKAGLLAELYYKTEEILSFPRRRESIPDNSSMDSRLRGNDVIITPQPQHDSTEVIVSVPDRKGLFALLSGAMAAAGASIVNARISTAADGTAADVFQVQTLKGHVYENTAFLQKTIRAALDGKIDIDAEIRERRKGLPRKNALFDVIPRVIIDNNASVGNTLIEVTAKDRPGLLYDITSELSRQGLQISSAKVTTFGSRAMDVFYVRDGFGLKILHPEKLKDIENAVKRALETGA